MSKIKKLWIFWGIAYLICTICAFIPVASGLLTALFVMLSVGFFVPPAMLLYEAVQRGEKKLLRIIRTLSILSLSLTLVAILLNFFAIEATHAWGLALYWILILVSTPMICSQFWVLGMFGWACLLMVCLKYLKKK